MNAMRTSHAYRDIATFLLYGIIAASLFFLWFIPQVTGRLGVEDGPVENMSALLLLVASIAMALQSFAQLNTKHTDLRLTATTLCVAAVFFVFAGEEISWGQRIIGMQSGEFMQQYNWQGEMNLHNLHTDISNIGYHYGAFIFLAILPLFRRQVTRLLAKLRLSFLAPLIAPVWLALPSFALLGMLDPRFIYVIEKPWAAALYILSLCAGVILLTWQLLAALRRNDVRVISLLLLSLLLIGAGLIVSHIQSADQMPNTISEYKELAIAAGLCIFALRWRAP